MNIRGFIWREDVVDKLAWKHQLQVAEIVELFADQPRIERLERGHRRGEDLYVASGQTSGGRYLAVFFVRKQDNSALIVTGRDMTTQERRRYAKS